MQIENFPPDFIRQLELLKIKSRRAFLGTRQGGHISLKRGHGIEFSDYRRYELGDDPRHIDWGVFARSEKLYVKKFQEEQDLRVYLILDTSASMFVPLAKWEFATGLALALSYVALMEQDSVNICTPGFGMSPQYHGGRAIHTLSHDLQKVKSGLKGNFMSEFRQVVGGVKFPGVAIVVSDLLMPLPEIQEMFNLLRARNLEITAIQLLGDEDLEPLAGNDFAKAVDSETGEEITLGLDEVSRSDYRAMLEDHNHSIQDFLASSAISYAQAKGPETLKEFVIKSLPTIGLLK